MHPLSPARKLTLCLLFAAATLALHGCGMESSDESSSPTAAAGQTAPAEVDESGVAEADVDESGAPARRYEWYMEGVTPAGRTAITRHGDGRISSDSFIHWNNREWTVNSELQLDEAGLPVRQRITGISPFQAPIDERFELSDGRARWKTVGDEGETTVTDPSFYFPAEPGALESLGALVRAALKTIDGEIALLPAGTARVEKVGELALKAGDATRTVSLYAISGLGFKPDYVWLDEELQLIGLDNSGWLGMVPEGWGTDALRAMSEAQTREAARYSTGLTERLAKPLEQPLVFENVNVVDVANGKLLENRHVRVADGIARVGEHSVCTSIVVAAELRFGAAKSGSKRLARQLDRILAALEVLPLGEPADRHYATPRRQLEKRGHPIGLNDLLIAAQALAEDCTLVTANEREFSRVPSLKVENWLGA